MVPVGPYGERFVQTGVLTPAAFIAAAFNGAHYHRISLSSSNAASRTRTSKLSSPMRSIIVRFCELTSIPLIAGSAMRGLRRGEPSPAGQKPWLTATCQTDIHIGKKYHGYGPCQVIFSLGPDPARETAQQGMSRQPWNHNSLHLSLLRPPKEASYCSCNKTWPKEPRIDKRGHKRDWLQKFFGQTETSIWVVWHRSPWLWVTEFGSRPPKSTTMRSSSTHPTSGQKPRCTDPGASCPIRRKCGDTMFTPAYVPEGSTVSPPRRCSINIPLRPIRVDDGVAT